MRSLLLLSAFVVAACGDDVTSAPGTTATEDLTISIKTTEIDGTCRPEITTTISGDVPIYMVKGEQKMDSKSGGQVTSFPLQIQFVGTSMDNVKKSKSILLSNYEIPCANMTIEWSDVNCQADDRSVMDCPAFITKGAKALGGGLTIDG
ncbi:MAG: hypothetical protein AAGA36_08095 [Pseudomonadota bacterium]